MRAGAAGETWRPFFFPGAMDRSGRAGQAGRLRGSVPAMHPTNRTPDESAAHRATCALCCGPQETRRAAWAAFVSWHGVDRIADDHGIERRTLAACVVFFGLDVARCSSRALALARVVELALVDAERSIDGAGPRLVLDAVAQLDATAGRIGGAQLDAPAQELPTSWEASVRIAGTGTPPAGLAPSLERPALPVTIGTARTPRAVATANGQPDQEHEGDEAAQLHDVDQLEPASPAGRTDAAAASLALP